MTRLELSLAADAVGTLDLAALNPASLAGKTLDQVRRLRLPHGTRSSALGDLFAVSGATGGSLRYRGLSAGCLRVGHAMREGLIEIVGMAGTELGRELAGGEIRVKGDAADGVGLGMRGGIVRISGAAGERVGGVVPGATHGMRDGAIVIAGNAGARAGERMRRGLLLIGGDSGAYTADRMVAGTIAVFGRCGPHAGLGMRRGTLLLAQAPQRLPATFNPCGTFEFGFVPLLVSHVATLERRYARLLSAFARAERWCGDMAHGGHGEILIAAGPGRGR